jgi:DNA mismatch endonuclease, patch repair protein
MKYDFHTTKERSRIMGRIKGKDTKIELKLRKALWHIGIRYRKNYRRIPGSPDIALTKYRIALFCDSDFWHGHDWPHRKERIHSNLDYWIPKIERNIERDREIDDQLVELGWLPLHFWEHRINRDLSGCIDEVLSYLPGGFRANNQQ